jgi:hypothetical protein
MVDKLEKKSLTLKEKDTLLSDLVNIIKKLQNQSNFQEELIKLASSNKAFSDSLSKLNINIKVPNNLKLKK